MPTTPLLPRVRWTRRTHPPASARRLLRPPPPVEPPWVHTQDQQPCELDVHQLSICISSSRCTIKNPLFLRQTASEADRNASFQDMAKCVRTSFRFSRENSVYSATLASLARQAQGMSCTTKLTLHLTGRDRDSFVACNCAIASWALHHSTTVQIQPHVHLSPPPHPPSYSLGTRSLWHRLGHILIFVSSTDC